MSRAAAAACHLQLPLADADATAALGVQLALCLKIGDVVTLSGALGSGKTTLARSLIQTCMGAAIIVPSPTFTLVQHYQTPHGTIAHYDWYRLRHATEVYELGFPDECDSSISLIEWPEQAEHFLPSHRLAITLTQHVAAGRSAVLSGNAAWTDRLHNLIQAAPDCFGA
jgi:tRNA threonylcarbamoyl adenosine modification protein YjeE